MSNRTKDAIAKTSTKELIRIHALNYDPEMDPTVDVYAALAEDVAVELERRYRDKGTPAAEKGRISGWLAGGSPARAGENVR